LGPRRDEVAGGWIGLNNEELHKPYSSPVRIRVIKSRKMRGVRHVAYTGRTRMHTV
jgi:hypothetical protein